MAGSCEYGYELSRFINVVEFRKHLRDCQLTKKKEKKKNNTKKEKRRSVFHETDYINNVT